MREVPGSIPSQGPRHTRRYKMVPVVPLFSTEHSKGKILALSQELRLYWIKSGIENPSKSEVIGRCGGDGKKTNDLAQPTKVERKEIPDLYRLHLNEFLIGHLVFVIFKEMSSEKNTNNQI